MHEAPYKEIGGACVCRPRGVSFIFGSFFGQKLENPEFCAVFVNKTMFRFLSIFFGLVILVTLFCEIVANTICFVSCV